MLARAVELMLEDQSTIAKAQKMIGELNSATDAQSKNQVARWIYQKEKHGKKIQDTIAQYFMHQRIKPKDPKYVDKLNSYNLDIEGSSIERKNAMAVPAVYVIGTDGVIDYDYVNADYRVRLPADDLLVVAQENVQ